MIQDQKTGSGGERKRGMTWKTNFDRYLEQHLSDSEFAERFRKAGESWDKVMRQSNDKENKTGKGIPRVISKVNGLLPKVPL